MVTNLIIGYGEIGKALEKVLPSTTIIDIKGVVRGTAITEVNVMNICFPYTKDFVKEVKKYQKEYSPKYTVLHSTVPIGISTSLNAIHSPVIGIHPLLENSLKTFTKFLGGPQAGEVADYFRRAGIKVYITDHSETTELMKIMDTTHYGIEIEFVKELKRQCIKHKVPFEIWSLWVNNYNDGYNKLGYPEYKKPNLIPMLTKQGGHCTIPNCELLENVFTKFLKTQNENNSKTI